METLVVLLLIGLGIYLFAKKKGNRSNTISRNDDRSISEEERIDEDLNFAALYERQIHDATRHVLESTYLMANSKNIDTIIGRYEFLEERIGTVRKASRTELGNLTIHEGVVQYEDQHGIDEIESYQDSLLFHSNEDARKVFFAKTLLIGFDKHYEDQMAEISDLKMDHAIKNRFNKLEEKFAQVNEIVEDLRHLNEVDKLMKKISSDYKKMEKNIRGKQIAE